MKRSIVLPGILGVFLVLLQVAPLAAAPLGNQDYYSREQLTQMLAPVALYPDALLSQVLMAATYPLEVVEADRFVRRNPLLTGENLNEALQNHDWDASVKALCLVPAVLGLMSERLDETTNLGNAFLAQERDVMDVVQDLRARAYREGNLRSDDKQKVTVLRDGTIVIEAADPQIVYVPYYNTSVVYGPWWYPAWPPWYWGPRGVVTGGGIYFWPDVYFGFSYGFGYWSYFDWPRRTIVIDVRRRPRFFRPDYDWQSRRGGWRHEPRHRRGVVYRDRTTAERFGQFRQRPLVDDRKVRGFPESERRGWSSGASRLEQLPGTAPDAKSSVRQRIEKGGTGGTTGERDRIRREQGGQIVSPPAAQERETVRGPVLLRERQRTTIFSGGENAREESRSSIRGRDSRGSMQEREPGRGTSSPSSRQQERGGWGRSR